MASCPAGFWADASTLRCEPCAGHCTTCFGPSQDECLSCNGTLGFVIAHNSCVKLECASGQFLVPGGTPSCAACDPSCKECVGALSTNCTHCADTRLLVNGS